MTLTGTWTSLSRARLGPEDPSPAFTASGDAGDAAGRKEPAEFDAMYRATLADLARRK